MNRSPWRTLSATLCLLIVAACVSRAASSGLAEVKDGKGLKMDSKRIKYRGSNSIGGEIAAQEGETRVLTANPNVIAFVGYDSKGSCRLRVLSGTGNRLSEIRCESSLVVIPEDKDIIWIGGKLRAEGAIEHGKQSPSAGLYAYDFNGRKLVSIDKETTGTVGLVEPLRSGGIVLLHATKDFRGISKFTESGGAEWKFPVSEPVTTIRAFNDGEFIATQAYFPKERRKKAALYGPGRKVVKTQEGSIADSPDILAVTADGQHFALATNRGRGRHLEIFPTNNASKKVNDIEVSHHIEKLSVDNSRRFLAMQFLESAPSGEQTAGFELMDAQGAVLAEQRCPRAQLGRVRIGTNQRSTSWTCGQERVELEVEGEQR